MEIFFMKAFSLATTLSVTGILALSSVTQAQHSYLPATEIGGDGTIETFVGDEPGRVVNNTFGTELADNVWRAGGPSAFLKDAPTPEVPDTGIPAGFETLAPNTDLTITNPELSHDMFSGSGNLLYWDMSGDTPDFGPAPANTTVTIQRLENSVLTFKATLDGSETETTWVEDTSNANGGRSGHFHLQYDVVGDETDAANEAPNGIYLLGHIVSMVGFGDSEMVAIPLLKSAFNFNDNPVEFAQDLAVLDSASSFLANNVVPEPAAGLVLAAGAGLALIARRRKGDVS